MQIEQTAKLGNVNIKDITLKEMAEFLKELEQELPAVYRLFKGAWEGYSK